MTDNGRSPANGCTDVTTSNPGAARGSVALLAVALAFQSFGELLEQRLDRATRLLETTDLPIDRIAEETGFPTGAALRLHFKRRTNLTPSAYRDYRVTPESQPRERPAA